MGLNACLLACYFVLKVSNALLPPGNLTFNSENFKHVLTWEDASRETPIYYFVEYSERHTRYKTVKTCSNVTTRHCDLTKDLTDLDSSYRVRVRSVAGHNSSVSRATKGFTPVELTLLGPPVVEIVACDRCIRVSVQPPVSYLWSEDEQQYVSMISYGRFSYMYYSIKVTHMDPVVNKEIDISEENSTLIPNLLPNTNYCVSVDIIKIPFTLGKTRASEVKCVLTENHKNESTTIYITVSVVCGVLLLIGLVLALIGLDFSGYICRAKVLIPEVLKSMPTSESIYIDGSEFNPPTFSIPGIISKKFELQPKPESEVINCEGGYANRKRLVDSDTSGSATSGELPSAVSSSVGSSGQTTVSAEEDISAGRLGNRDPSGVSITPVSVSATEDSTNLPFDAGGVFNIKLNTVSIADRADVWTDFRQAEVHQEEAKDSMESQEALGQHSNVCIEVEDLTEEYYSDYEEEEEEDSSENTDSDSHLISGYMKR
ncbi:interferon alpha/beta receptor 2 [Dendropsophus ebraccatus]|uniref:interferon alpha/beta receptor 2 n=1 Tax=Dendropsophus ebraccatus TaxID=150705 RepID=UPI003831628B